MALSYLQDTQIDAGLLIGQPLDMKQVVEKQTSLNNNTQTLFPAIGADTAAEVSILTPQQLLAASQSAAAFIAAGLPVSLHTDMLAKPSLYHHNFFNAWPATASSPPSSLHHSPGTMPPITRSAVRRNNGVSVNNNNNNNNTNNNNTTSDSVDKKSHVTNKKNGSCNKVKTRVAQENAVMARIVASFKGGPSGRGGPPGKGGGASAVRTASRGAGRKAFRCPTCLKSFGYKHVLQNHERTHTGEKPFECMECHKRFTRDHHLKTHMRLHTGEKPYHCNHCERQFVQVANLRRHLRVHTGERPYACDVCSSKFSDSNQLKAHSLIHKGEKPFECQTCQMRFRRRHHLMHHKCGAGPQSGIDARSPVNSSSEASNADDGEDSVNTGGSEMMEVELAVSSANSVVAPARIPVTPYQPPSPAIGSTSRSIPLNLPVISIPEQTEPEDLSMSTGMHRLHVTNDDDVEMSNATQRRTQQALDSKVYAYDSTSGLIVRESLRTKCNHLSATKRKSKTTIAKICRSS